MLVSPHVTVLVNSMMIQEQETLLVHVPIMCEESTSRKHRAKTALAYWTDYFLTRLAGGLPTWSVFYCIRLRISEHTQSLSFYCGQRLLLVGFCSPLWVLDLLSSSVVVIL